MKKYESYKDSGNDWVGEIPKCWIVSKIRFEGELYGGLTGKAGSDFNNDENNCNKPFIPFTNIFNNQYISENDFQLVNISENENQNKVEKNDIFFLMSSEKIEELGKCSTILSDIPELYLNSFCKGFRITGRRISNRFLNYQLSGNSHRQMIFTQGRGFTRINLRQESVLNTPIYFPNFKEQTQIANYLDHKTQQIDALIEKKERLITLLEEERTAIINQAVTKGLDPNVKMKDSGIEWLGEIPESWDAVKLRFLANIIPSNVDKKTKEGEKTVFLCNYTDVYKNDYIRHNPDFMRASASNAQIEKLSLKKHDVIVTKDSEDPNDIGVPALVLDNLEGVVCGYHLTVFRSKEDNGFGRFLFWFLKSNTCSDYFATMARGITRYALGTNAFKELSIPIPENEIFFEKISNYLESKVMTIQTIINKASREKDYLKEYKTTLISEVVTGKIDVREDVSKLAE